MIVSSIIESDDRQIDGRRWIHEVHTDSIGVLWDKHYLCEPGFDAQGQLVASAAQLWTDIVNGEIQTGLTDILTRGANATPSTIYATMDQLTAAARPLFATATSQDAVLLGEWFNSLSYAQLQKAFGFTTAMSYTNFKNAHFVPNANNAAAVRSSVGA
jgi:hypothetical protein